MQIAGRPSHGRTSLRIYSNLPRDCRPRISPAERADSGRRRQVVRSYGGDVSRLTDVCRQSIIFDGPAGVAACLRAVAADPEAVVLRVKNRLDPAYDARSSAGYR
jgi:hypothetical protein